MLSLFGKTIDQTDFMKTRMKTKTNISTSKERFQYHPERARPKIGQRAAEIQAFGTIDKLPNALSEKVCQASVERLNQILADTMTIRDLYKKHHWQASGKTFYQLHLLFDKHFEEQAEMVDQIAERIQMLGGLSYAMAADVAENGWLDGLTSDYVPSSLLHGAFLLFEQHCFSLPAAIATVTSAPAAMVRLDDRGSLKPGLRADVVGIRRNGNTPRVIAVWRAGIRVV